MFVGVLIVGVVGLAVSISSALLGAGFLRTSTVLERSSKAKVLAQACAEYGLEKLRESTGYAGNETLTIGSSTCSVLSVLGSGNTNRTVQATSTEGTVTSKVNVVVAQVAPQITITSWHDVADLP